jgi:SAM-dependent methyltransferase
MIESILEKKNYTLTELQSLKVLDPACGSGQFLIHFYDKLYQKYLAHNCTLEEASHFALNNIYGFDIDAKAILIAKKNISKLSGIAPELVKIHKMDFIYKDNLQFDQQHILNEQFDVIIGNPPWGSTLSAEEKKYYRKNYYSAKSGINTFTLFIERSLEQLKEKGSLSLLIPEAFLNIKAHQNCREIILNNSEIKKITLWGDCFKNVFAPSISVQTEKNSSFEKDNTIHIYNKSRNGSYGDVMIKQKHLIGTHQNIINVNFSERAMNLIHHISDQDCFYLQNKAKFFLGIVTGNNPKYLSTTQSDEFPDRIIQGRDLSKFQVGEAKKFFKYDPSVLQQAAPQNLYQSKDKILYKFIGKKLTFAMDREGLYSLNNVNGFIPNMDSTSAEAMIAVLNSSLMQYFYEKNFFTVKVLRGNLEKLPLKKLSQDATNLLSNLARNAAETSSMSELNSFTSAIDDIVFHEYDIKDKHAYHIWEESNTTKFQQILPGI